MQADRIPHPEHDTPPCRRQRHAGQQRRERPGGVVIVSAVSWHEPAALDDQSAATESVDTDTRPAAPAHGPRQFNGVARLESHAHARTSERCRRPKQVPHASGDGEPHLRAAPQPGVAVGNLHHLDRTGYVIVEPPGFNARAGERRCAIRQPPCRRKPISRRWLPAGHPEMNAGPVDHHTDTAVGTDAWHPKRQHAQVQPRRGFHFDGVWPRAR